MTLDQFVDSFSEGLEDWQREANYQWAVRAHSSLREGGLLISSNLNTTFEKVGNGFIVKSINRLQ